MAALIWSHFYSTIGFIQLLAALIWSHFLFNFLFLFNLNGCPYLVTLILSLLHATDLLLIYFFFFLFFSLEKKVSYLGFEPGTS